MKFCCKKCSRKRLCLNQPEGQLQKYGQFTADDRHNSIPGSVYSTGVQTINLVNHFFAAVIILSKKLRSRVKIFIR